MSTALTTAPQSPLLALGDELLRMLALHLKPRHLLKLLCANRALHKLLMEHECYWTRVAAHLTWRDRVVDEPIYDDPPSWWPTKKENATMRTYYAMVNLERGYYASMEHFLSIIPKVMRQTRFLSVPVHFTDAEWSLDDPGVEIFFEGDYYGWNNLADASLDIKVRKILKMRLDRVRNMEKPTGSYSDKKEIRTISMWEICKREVTGLIKDTRRYNKAVQTLINFLDDNQDISIPIKKEIGHGIVKAFNADKYSYVLQQYKRMEYPVMNATNKKIHDEHICKLTNISYYMASFTTR